MKIFWNKSISRAAPGNAIASLLSVALIACQAPQAESPAEVTPVAPQSPARPGMERPREFLPDPGTLDAMLARAAEAKKPLVIELATYWCGPCRYFSKRILPDSGVQAELSKVVFVQYDAESDNGLTISERYFVNSYPTFLGFDARGEVVVRREGVDVGDTSWFLEILARAQRAHQRGD